MDRSDIENRGIILILIINEAHSIAILRQMEKQLTIKHVSRNQQSEQQAYNRDDLPAEIEVDDL